MARRATTALPVAPPWSCVRGARGQFTPLDGLKQVQYLKEFGNIYKRLEKRLEPVLVNQEQWKRDKTYLWHEDRIVVPSDRIPALLK